MISPPLSLLDLGPRQLCVCFSIKEKVKTFKCLSLSGEFGSVQTLDISLSLPAFFFFGFPLTAISIFTHITMYLHCRGFQAFVNIWVASSLLEKRNRCRRNTVLDSKFLHQQQSSLMMMMIKHRKSQKR